MLRQGFLSEKFSQGELKDKTRLVQDKSTTVRVYFSNNIERTRQGFLSKKLSKNIKRSCQGFLSEKLSQGKLKDKTRLVQDKSTTVRVYFSNNIERTCQGFLSKKLSKNIKRWLQGFLSEKLRKSRNKVIVKEAKVPRRLWYS
ncbi:hypothetical protein M0802_016304 [Mischocyttarus mexicanus]|nr:hypothetical protein M0802_016304 [Mischocyttarus mexicanus]